MIPYLGWWVAGAFALGVILILAGLWVGLGMGLDRADARDAARREQQASLLLLARALPAAGRPTEPIRHVPAQPPGRGANGQWHYPPDPQTAPLTALRDQGRDTAAEFAAIAPLTARTRTSAWTETGRHRAGQEAAQ